MVRWGAFRRKRDAFGDFTFNCDFALACVAVLDTWVLTLVVTTLGLKMGDSQGNMKVLLVFKILRLFKLFRLGRVMRCLPELLVIIRGIRMAVHSVSVIIGLLSAIIYVSAILFRVVLDGTRLGAARFNNMGQAMGTLLLDCTLSGTRGINVMYEADEEHLIYACLLLLFVLFSNITVMGVLAGSLVQAIKTVAEVEKADNAMKNVGTALDKLWEDFDRHISSPDDSDQAAVTEEDLRKHFDSIFCEQRTKGNFWFKDALERIDVDSLGLRDVMGFILETNGGKLTESVFKKMVLDLRSKNLAKVKDHVATRKFFNDRLRYELNLRLPELTPNVIALNPLKRISKVSHMSDAYLPKH
jgi:hypothetical protein